MKVKEILRTATQAWSPAAQHPAYLALGTSAQQLDASFNTTAALEIFEMDFADASMQMKLSGSLTTANRFHSLIWVRFGMDSGSSLGHLIGGGESGTLTVFSPDAIISNREHSVVGQSTKHMGPVRALDYNPFQSHLLASGANDSEIYIWDLNNFSNPMTPGTKSQPVEDVSVVAWNKQVQHILASAGVSGRAVVWDLRKNEPIIKISDHSSRMHCSGMLWHPDVATQLVLASEDDRLPVIQMWDLRFATSPLRVLERHTRGILSVSWSQADSDLLLSSAKDNRILCWNPNTGEVVYELPTANQWCFDVQWCPRNPAFLSAASFDGHVSVYTVMGGCLETQQYGTVDKVSAAFDTSDPFGTGQSFPPLQVPPSTATPTIIPHLRTPPKWVRRPVGASFSFGGKLVMFENTNEPPQLPPQPLSRQVYISQVTTETEFLQRSRELQLTLQNSSYISYCQNKISSAPSDAEQDIWRFLLVNFEDEARIKFLRLLGFNKEELERKISSCLGKGLQPISHMLDVNDLTQKMQTLSAQRDNDADVPSPAEVLNQQKTLFQIPVSTDTDGLISQALLVGDFDGAVELCLSDGRFAEAILLSISGGEELLKKTQHRFLMKHTNSLSVLIWSVVTQNWREVVEGCELDNWKEALAALLTYAKPEEFAALCDALGSRLEAGGTEKRCLQACLCYICSGNINKLVECWTSQKDISSPLTLEDLMEKVMMLWKSIERTGNSKIRVQNDALVQKLIQYANLLASQGSLDMALSYLPENSDQAVIKRMRDDLSRCQSGGTQVLQPAYHQASVDGAKAAPMSSSVNTNTAALNAPSQVQCPSAVTHQMLQTGQPVMSPLITPQKPQELSRAGSRPAYPQYATTTPGLPSSQPVGRPLSFPPGSNLPPSSLSGSVPPPFSATRGIVPGPMPMQPTLPAPGFMFSTSVPSIPPSFLPGGPVPMYSGTSQPQVPTPPPSSTAYLLSGIGYPPGGPGASGAKCSTNPSVPPPPTGSHEGWNDPPTVRRGSRNKKLPGDFMPPAPITTPVINVHSETPLHPDRVQVPPGAPQEPNLQVLQQLPAEKVEQREIPAEHIVLKNTFDSLVQRCQLAATDPQTKRKLEEASKRIVSLYDKLREQSLSSSILAGLHEISCCVSSRNYTQGLEVHTQVVRSSSFSEISAFMPVLKVLMTIGHKLGV